MFSKSNIVSSHADTDIAEINKFLQDNLANPAASDSTAYTVDEERYANSGHYEVNDEVRTLRIKGDSKDIADELKNFFYCFAHQGGFQNIGLYHLVTSLAKIGLTLDDGYTNKRIKYFFFEKNKIMLVETYSMHQLIHAGAGVSFHHAKRDAYKIKDFPDHDFKPDENTIYMKMEIESGKKSRLVYKMQSALGGIIEDTIDSDDLICLRSAVNRADIERFLPHILDVTFQRGHTRQLLPIAKAITISFIEVDEKNQPVINIQKHAIFSFDKFWNDSLFYNQQDKVFQRFHSTPETVDTEIYLLMMCNLLAKNSFIAANDPGYQTPQWLQTKKENLYHALCGNYDSDISKTLTSFSLNNLFVAMNKLSKGRDSLSIDLFEQTKALLKQHIADTNDIKALIHFIRLADELHDSTLLKKLCPEFSKHVAEIIQKDKSDVKKLLNDLKITAQALLDPTPDTLLDLHKQAVENDSRKDTIVASTSSTVISAGAATAAFLSGAGIPVTAAIGLFGAVASGSICNTITDNQKNLSSKPAEFEKGIMDALLHEFVKNEQYGKWIYTKIAVLKNEINNRGKNETRDTLIENLLDAALDPAISNDFTATTNALRACCIALMGNNSNSKTARSIKELISSLLQDWYSANVENSECKNEMMANWILLSIQDIMDNATMRKTQTSGRDETLSALFHEVQVLFNELHLDEENLELGQICGLIEQAITMLRETSSRSSSAIELETLNKQINEYLCRKEEILTMNNDHAKIAF